MTALDLCPDFLRDRDVFYVTTYANAPYGPVSEVVVEVPPVADPDDPFIENVRTNVSLTPGLSLPPNWNELPGWDATAERQAISSLRDRLRYIVALQNLDVLHPDVRQPAAQIAQYGIDQLDDIERIYDRWRDARLAAKSGPAREIGLRWSWNQIAAWMAEPDPAYRWFYEFRPLLEGEKGGWSADVPQQPEHFGQALYAARVRDRIRVRNRLRNAYKALYCAEYGVAQSDSFYGNKATYDDKARRGAVGLDLRAPAMPPLTEIPTIGQVYEADLPVEPPVPPPAPPKPPTRTPPEGGPAPVPPDAAPPPSPPTPTPTRSWYQTTAGKAALAVGAVSLVTAVGYGIYGARAA